MNIIKRQLTLSAAVSARLNLSGIWPPIPTPFDQTEKTIDYGVLKSNMRRWGECGFRGITVQGSNGSYPYLSTEERVELVSSVRSMIDESNSEMLLMAGAGAESTLETQKMCDKMADAGADCFLIVTPFFYKNAMDNDALVKHFTKVADHASKPVVLYSVPANTGIDMAAETIAELASHPNICGVKDSGGDITKIGQVLRLTDGIDDFQVLAGSASFLYSACSLGASGGVCALANVLGKEVVELFDLTKSGKHEQAVALQKRLIAPNQAVTRVFGVPGLKAAMEEFDYETGHLRSPLCELDATKKNKVLSAFTANKFKSE